MSTMRHPSIKSDRDTQDASALKRNIAGQFKDADPGPVMAPGRAEELHRFLQTGVGTNNVADMAVPGFLAWLDDGCPDVRMIRGRLSRLRRHGVGPGQWAKIRDRLISWGEREIERRMVAGGPIDDEDEIGRQCRAVAMGLADSHDDSEPLNDKGIARCPDCGSTALEREQVRAGVLGCVECMWVQPKAEHLSPPAFGGATAPPGLSTQGAPMTTAVMASGVNEYPQDDTEFTDYTLTEVRGDRENGWELHFDGFGFWCPKDSPVEPKAGMTTRQYGRGFGFPVRGLFIDGRKVFYRTAAEDAAKHKADVAESARKRREEYETTGKAKLDAQYDALPPIFKARIDKFRRNNPDFRWEFEGYEMFCCTQAVVIAETLKTAEKIREFHKLDSWKKQKEMVPGLEDGHSGNTFGCACSLALFYLERPEGVEKSHGALAPLVGSEEYGCVPRETVKS